jgi:hypothetical protein
MLVESRGFSTWGSKMRGGVALHLVCSTEICQLGVGRARRELLTGLNATSLACVAGVAYFSVLDPG